KDITKTWPRRQTAARQGGKTAQQGIASPYPPISLFPYPPIPLSPYPPISLSPHLPISLSPYLSKLLTYDIETVIMGRWGEF
ncbi:hypothetical protein, partial [Moorena sp. SIO4G3]|uniref:hypothetical protein n=1 Tax=Moorena sp. SIO4G3 TaxID=2607821 RepID=UPI0025E45696